MGFRDLSVCQEHAVGHTGDLMSLLAKGPCWALRTGRWTLLEAGAPGGGPVQVGRPLQRRMHSRSLPEAAQGPCDLSQHYKPSEGGQESRETYGRQSGLADIRSHSYAVQFHLLGAVLASSQNPVVLSVVG